jgi:hypothetical protein
MVGEGHQINSDGYNTALNKAIADKTIDLD